MNETKVRILDAAERLIAEHGLDVSLRTITTDAGVNLAAVNYHFQSKEALLEALVCRRFEYLNERRLEMLSLLEREMPEGRLPLERVLEAFLGPVLEVKHKAPAHYRQLMGRLFSMPDELIKRIFQEQMRPIVTEFNRAFRRALPHMSEREIAWRMIFSIGCVVHLMSWSKILPLVSSGFVELDDPGVLLQRVIAFTAGGFRATIPALEGEN